MSFPLISFFITRDSLTKADNDKKTLEKEEEEEEGSDSVTNHYYIRTVHAPLKVEFRQLDYVTVDSEGLFCATTQN